MPAPECYTVGWICAIGVEYVAAQLLLDQKHADDFAAGPNDNNAYTRGAMGQHNIVITVLPYGEYGTASAAAVARDLVRTFHNIRVGLMVGIGGGAPTAEHDIRLGDIVVSVPRDGNGGIFQYDFGKTLQDESFKTTEFLNQPPTMLRTAAWHLSAEHTINGHDFEAEIERTLQSNPRLQDGYNRPDPRSDRLYYPTVLHPATDAASCESFCGDGPSKVIVRKQRKEFENNPAIHYGLIASANQVMKNAVIRDKLAAEKGVLCFEMEAAGLVNHFPCLVVRGISDYCDSHKSKAWQGYAAMTAATYAKDLLRHITSTTIAAEKKLVDIVQGELEIYASTRVKLRTYADYKEVAEKSLAVSKRQLEVSAETLKIKKMRISKEEIEEHRQCHQIFRLVDGSQDAGYEWYKERVEETVEGTCMWLLKHNKFQDWLQSKSGPLLVTADPGCGKSVLAKYLVDHVLSKSSTICYFFFQGPGPKYGLPSDLRTAPSALHPIAFPYQTCHERLPELW